MGKSSPDPTPAPDPAATAAAQGAANLETAKAQAALNRIGQVSPFGTVSFQPSGPDPNTGLTTFNQVTKLSPEQQRQFALQQGLQGQLLGLAGSQFGRVEETLGTPFSFEGLPQVPGQEDLLGERQRIEDTLFQGRLDRLNPQFDRQEDRLRTQLANQGIVQGSEAFGTEIEGLRESQGDITRQALSEAIATGGAEQSRLFGLGQAGRQQAIQEEAFLRNLPLNEISALLSGTQIQSPQAAPIPQVGVAPTDVISPTLFNQQQSFQQAQAEADAKNAFANNLLGFGGQLGAAGLLAFCSRTFKNPIGKGTELLQGVDDLEINRWEYKEELVGVPEGEHIGPYAEDFKKIFNVGDGKTINLIDAFGICLGAIKELSKKVKQLEAQNA